MKRTKRFALLGALALVAAVGGVGTASAASDTPDGAKWNIPDGEGSWAGTVTWDDYNVFGGADTDNFILDDRNLDGQSASLKVWNHYSGKEYYIHAYNGAAYTMDVGNIPNGYSAKWKACGWDDGVVLECRSGSVYE